jgi:low temperature requirement protein LtrA
MGETGIDKVNAVGRRATWFELFFDLVFVAGVARLSGLLAADFSLSGFVRFAFLFLVLWWCWVAHTFYATRFDRDEPAQRLLGLATIASIVFVAFAAPLAFGAQGVVFGIAVAAFKALLGITYAVAAMQSAKGRPVARIYVAIQTVGAAIWGVSSLVDNEALRIGLWIVGLAVDVASPFIVTRFTHALPPHPEHLPERFGLFTIILFGESVAALVHGVDHLPTIGMLDVATVCLAMMLPFLFWWGYFDTVRGVAERHVHSREDARRLQIWAYAHIPLFLGTAVIAVGGRLVVEHATFSLAQSLLFSGAAGIAMAALTLIAASHAGPRQSRVIFFIVAAITAASGLAGVFVGSLGLLVLLVALAALQTGIGIARSR